MRTLDRTLVIVALAVAAVAILRPTTSSTIADSPNWLLETLGPAESLELSGDPGLLVRNEEGRIAWGEEPTSRSWSVGAVHIDSIIKRLLQTEDYLGEREEICADQRGAGAPLEADGGSADFESAMKQIHALRLRATFTTAIC